MPGLPSKTLGTLDWLLMTLRAKSDGIAWDTTVHGTPGKAFKNVQAHASDGSLQKLVPTDALLYLAFHGSKGMLGGLGSNPIMQQFGAKGLGTALKQVGTILAGENALYVRAGTKDVPEVTFIAAPGGGVNGAAALDRVLSRFSKELGAQPKRTTIAGIPARVIGAGPIAVRYANVKGRLVITDLPSGIVFAKQGGKTLADSQEYQDAAASSGLPSLAPGRALRRHPQHDSGDQPVRRWADSGRAAAEPEASALSRRIRRQPLPRAADHVLLAHQVVGRSV